MANDKNLRTETILFPLQMLKNQSKCLQSLLSESYGVSISFLSKVFAGKPSLPAEAAEKLRRFHVPRLRKDQKLHFVWKVTGILG
jgi:hypothetical protein